LNSAIHNFAKRQMTWFRKMEREGVVINWFQSNSYPQIKDFVENQLSIE
jgi:tRNA dimethylallyltransferase